MFTPILERGRDLDRSVPRGTMTFACSLVVAGLLQGCSTGVPVAPRQSQGVFNAPSSIVSDCSVDVTSQLLAWIASVPDSSTLMFGKDACYNIDGGLVVDDRNHLVFEGSGATFRVFSRGGPNRSNWMFRGGSQITLRNMIARGAHPYAGTGDPAYDQTLEWQHAYAFGGTQTATLENVQGYDVFGDFVEASRDVRARPGPPARNITVRGSHFERNGRMGIGLTHVDGFALEDSYVGDIRWSAVDLELDVDDRIGRGVRIVRNRFGAVRHSLFSHGGIGIATGNVVFSDNEMLVEAMTCQPPIVVKSPAGRHWTGYVFENNLLRTRSTGVLVIRAKNVVVRGNTITRPANGCNSYTSAVKAQDSHGGLVTLNIITGPEQVLAADTLTTGFQVIDNELRPSTSPPPTQRVPPAPDMRPF